MTSMIRFGERGLTALQKFSRSAGCLVMFGMFAAGSGLAGYAAVWLACEAGICRVAPATLSRSA